MTPRRGRWNYVRLVREPGTTPQDPTRIATPVDVFNLLRGRMAQEEVEVFYVIALDAQSRVRAIHELTRGILNASLVHQREVFRFAILAGAAGIIVAHNHPSGDPTPSNDDRAVTRQLVEAGRLIDNPRLRPRHHRWRALRQLRGGRTPMIGTVIQIVDHGTIVQLVVRDADSQRTRRVNFDHRPFSWLYESEGDPRGRTIELEEVDGQDVVRFLD